MVYRPIEPFPEDHAELASAELEGLAKIWRERRGELEAGDLLAGFLDRMQREWAIETGLIERLYTWDRGVTETLIEHGIYAATIAHKGGLDRERAEQAKRLIDDQQGVIDGLFDFVKQDRELSEHYIRSLHQGFTLHQETTEAETPGGRRVQVELLRGEYKRRPNNPRRHDNGTVHDYCPPERVQDEMERLVRWTKEAQAASPEVLAAWLHHRFTQIHPFQDGNGRVARALATLVFLRAGLFPLVVRDSDRDTYLDALGAADGGDLRPLVRLLAERQRDAVMRALGLAESSAAEQQAEAIVDSALASLRRRLEASPPEDGLPQELWTPTTELTEHLVRLAENRFTELCRKLGPELESLELTSDAEPGCQVTLKSGQANRPNLLELTRQLDYIPPAEIPSRWVQLDIVTFEDFRLVVDFHGYGPRFRGVMAAGAYSYRRAVTPGFKLADDSRNPLSPIQPAMPRTFQFNAAEKLESIDARFRGWLEEVLVLGLDAWRLSLG